MQLLRQSICVYVRGHVKLCHVQPPLVLYIAPCWQSRPDRRDHSLLAYMCIASMCTYICIHSHHEPSLYLFAITTQPGLVICIRYMSPKLQLCSSSPTPYLPPFMVVLMITIQCTQCSQLSHDLMAIVPTYGYHHDIRMKLWE